MYRRLSATQLRFLGHGTMFGSGPSLTLRFIEVIPYEDSNTSVSKIAKFNRTSNSHLLRSISAFVHYGEGVHF